MPEGWSETLAGFPSSIQGSSLETCQAAEGPSLDKVVDWLLLKRVEAQSQGHAHSLQTSVPLSALTMGTRVCRRVSARSSPNSVASLSPLTLVSSWVFVAVVGVL